MKTSNQWHNSGNKQFTVRAFVMEGKTQEDQLSAAPEKCGLAKATSWDADCETRTCVTNTRCTTGETLSTEYLRDATEEYARAVFSLFNVHSVSFHWIASVGQVLFIPLRLFVF